jgi:catechol 2,3-dioxygenase-like lactoylglutathione lyase family enzyme
VSTIEARSSDAARNAGAATIDMKLEVVVIPVSDIEGSKEFYTRIGWRPEIDRSAGDDFRLVQFTPPGSCCSVHFGKNVTSAAPGSAKSFLIVSDIVAARDHLVAAGVEVGAFFHDGPEGKGAACIPRVFPAARAPCSVIPTAMSGTCRRSRPRTRYVPVPARLRSARQASWRARFGARLPLTMCTRSVLGSATRTGRIGTPPTWWLRRPARSCRNNRLRRDRLSLT